jgi:hypothetical protein
VGAVRSDRMINQSVGRLRRSAPNLSPGFQAARSATTAFPKNRDEQLTAVSCSLESKVQTRALASDGGLSVGPSSARLFREAAAPNWMAQARRGSH